MSGQICCHRQCGSKPAQNLEHRALYRKKTPDHKHIPYQASEICRAPTHHRGFWRSLWNSNEIRDWCAEGRGRQAKIAELLEVSRGWSTTGSQADANRGTNEYLTLRAFLSRQRPASMALEEGDEESG